MSKKINDSELIENLEIENGLFIFKDLESPITEEEISNPNDFSKYIKDTEGVFKKTKK